MAFLSVSMFGPFRTMIDGTTAVGYESCKVRALLAYLVSESNCPQQRSHLAGLFWPDLPEPAALSNLRHALANLRRVLCDTNPAKQFILADRNELQFNVNSDHYCDVYAFARLVKANNRTAFCVEPLERAVALYQGDFLDGMEIKASAAFDEWVLLKREQLGWLLMSTLHTLCDAFEQAGCYDKVIAYARHLVYREPWDELGHEKLMRAFALSGHRADALREYIHCRQLLQTELQVEPGQSITSLFRCIRDGTFPDHEVAEHTVFTSVLSAQR